MVGEEELKKEFPRSLHYAARCGSRPLIQRHGQEDVAILIESKMVPMVLNRKTS